MGRCGVNEINAEEQIVANFAKRRIRMEMTVANPWFKKGQECNVK